ncbi:MAG: class II glutamine amidotransferase [Clostridia bacterium]|nr:class II glutamine amidotransferase [Clostridia bacterium]
MCGLFGFSAYADQPIKGLSDLTNALAEQSAVRGIDATGIAFCRPGGINIHKEAKSAYSLDFKHSDDIPALISHTRHSTQGDEKKNFNNHPFYGKAKGTRFALAHNGVLMNDEELRKSLNLSKTKIETDSFIAVQLIESRRVFNIDSIKYMAEQVKGSFSFSILDDRNNVYLVKGDSPLSILHFPKQKIYIYASTEQILYKALVDTKLFEALKIGDYEEIPVEEGEILKIRSDGKIERYHFHYSYYKSRGWWEYDGFSAYRAFFGQSTGDTREDYINALKSIAAYQGISVDVVDALLEEGWDLEMIEEYIYDYEYG